jgi:hypothetical protein
MSQSQRTRVARLEKRVARYLAQEAASLDSFQDADGYLDDFHFNLCADHAINLAYLIQFGDPKVGEPLSEAWKRTGYSGRCDPFTYSGAGEVSRDIRSTVFPHLPGGTLKEKLDRIFESAPAWLIWFAYGDMAAAVLHLKLPPDLLSVVKFARPRECYCAQLPSGAFEYRPWPADWTPSDEEAALMRKAGMFNTKMSRRERKRLERRAEEAPPFNPPVKWPDEPTTQ